MTTAKETTLPPIAVAIKPLPKENQPLPALELKDASGAKIDLASFRGRHVLLHGWAGWCSACPKDYEAIRKLRKEFPEAKLQIVGLNLDSEPATATKLAAKYSFTWPQVCLGEAEKSPDAEKLRITAIPLYIVLAPDGTMAFRVGYWLGAEKVLRDRLRN